MPRASLPSLSIPLVLLLAALCWAPAALAAPTAVDVHVLSRGAKFVGDGVGGSRVTIRDSRTGEVLAQGVTEGTTGDTDLIMREARARGTTLVTDDAARFSVTLELERPRHVEVRAWGPLDYPDSAKGTSATGWLLPGQARTGAAAWVLELPGLVVDLHDVPTLTRLGNGEVRLAVQATVQMMCGCPLTPKGLWDSNAFDIEARVARDGVVFASTPLSYAGAASEFEGELLLTQPGTYELSVRAFQPTTGNVGLDRMTLVVD